MEALQASAQYISSDNTRVAITLRGAASTQRQPVHLIFLIDVSDSMRDQNKIGNVKRSIEFLCPLLTEDDMVSLITFGDDSLTLLKFRKPSDLLQAAPRLRTDGCTNMSAGLLNVMHLMQEPDGFGSPGHKHGVLLLTDGHANRGVSTKDGLLTIISQILQANPSLTLTTIGYGENHNADLLQSAASSGAGSYNVVNTLEDVATVFGEVLGGLTTVVAQNVVVQLPPRAEPQTGYPLTSDGHVRIGDIYAENEVIILYNQPEIPVSAAASTAPQIEPIVKGMAVLPLEYFSQSISLASFSEPVPKNIQIASFRYRVSQMLKARSRDQATILRDELRALPFASENLIQMMIEDCETVLNHVDERGHIPERMVSGLTQHACYLDLGRGLRSVVREDAQDPSPHSWALQRTASTPFTPGPCLSGSPVLYGFSAAAGGADINSVPPLAPIRTARVNYAESPFSNRTQVSTVSLMRSVSAPAPAPRTP